MKKHHHKRQNIVDDDLFVNKAVKAFINDHSLNEKESKQINRSD